MGLTKLLIKLRYEYMITRVETTSDHKGLMRLKKLVVGDGHYLGWKDQWSEVLKKGK